MAESVLGMLGSSDGGMFMASMMTGFLIGFVIISFDPEAKYFPVRFVHTFSGFLLIIGMPLSALADPGYGVNPTYTTVMAESVLGEGIGGAWLSAKMTGFLIGFVLISLNPEAKFFPLRFFHTFIGVLLIIGMPLSALADPGYGVNPTYATALLVIGLIVFIGSNVAWYLQDRKIDRIAASRDEHEPLE